MKIKVSSSIHHSAFACLAWMPFLVGGVCMIGLTMVTMAYQVIKAARTNPVEVLRQG